MGENEGSFVPPGVDPGAGSKEFIEGEKARQAAIGSGQRAEEAREEAAKKLRERAEKAAKEAADDPKKLEAARKAINDYRRVTGRNDGNG